MQRPAWQDFNEALDGLAAWPMDRVALVADGLSLAQVLVHAAQGIEYSVQGFPQQRPRWFQRSIGRAVFAWFSWRGRMSHDLQAPLPGAPAIDPDTAEADALLRLRQAIAAFRAWRGPLQPHFVYGELDRAGHERAHAMHLADHLAAFMPER